MERLERALDQAGYKATDKRRVIYRVLRDNPGRHLEAEEILSLAKDLDDSIGIATVYRALGLFTGLGLASSIGNKYEIRYEGLEKTYPHFLCDSCGQVVSVGRTLDIIGRLREDAEKVGFNMRRVNLNIAGLCRECGSRD